MLWWSCVSFSNINIITRSVLNLINNSLKNCAVTNNSSFKMILNFYGTQSNLFQNQKNLVFPRFSQLSETWVFKFCPGLEILVIAYSWFCNTQKCLLRFVMSHLHFWLTSRLSIKGSHKKKGCRTKCAKSLSRILFVQHLSLRSFKRYRTYHNTLASSYYDMRWSRLLINDQSNIGQENNKTCRKHKH